MATLEPKNKMSGMEGGENWSKLCRLGGPRVSTLALILEG